MKLKQVKKKQEQGKVVVQRTSTFFETEVKIVEEMLTGKCKFMKQDAKNGAINKAGMNKVTASMSR